MPFKRFVEAGRVAYISHGRYKGKLCSIVDVIDQTRALVDGPETGVPRVPIRLNDLHLTKLCVKFPFIGSTKVVRKAWKDNGILEKWRGSQWAKNLVNRRKKKSMTDFDRFKLRNARKIRNKIRTIEYYKLLKDDNKQIDKMRKRLRRKRGDAKPEKPRAKKEGAAKGEKPKSKKEGDAKAEKPKQKKEGDAKAEKPKQGKKAEPAPKK